jgi:hypothetical protein
LESFPEASGSGQNKERLRGEVLTNDGVKQNMEKGPEQVAVEQDMAKGKKKEDVTKTEATAKRSGKLDCLVWQTRCSSFSRTWSAKLQR